ncbi:conserved hypothetical protein [Vibrio nigripulchritudo SOn1]|uniref:Uncharacterized protein n=1 Tax=Vibrio nigripulchritudo SOn1 TaxID=1238450 RepID=A0AAV2VQL5_9VIBR|nr:hypothetical protein [Vibrio nigripulchritudo]CCO47010.1 conserved hypothetical protein [Vibrio nigripulchritudo SOn1]
MQNSKFQCLSYRNKAKRDNCLKSAEVQDVDIYVLEAKAFTALWVANQKRNGLSDEQIDAKALALGIAGFAASNGSTIHDARDFYLLAEDLKKGGSILSKYEVTSNGQKSYIKFKGNHKLRSLVKGTRYLSNNAKVIALGIGKEGMRASAKAGVLVTVIYSVAFRTLELALTKNYSISDWVTNISADVIKAAISTVFGLIIGGIAASSGVVLIPLVLGGVAAFAMGKMLDYLDGRFLIKEKIVKALNDYINDQAKSDLNNDINKWISSKSFQTLKTNPHGFSF